MRSHREDDAEMRVRSLDGEDPLEKEMATSSSILAWKIPWTRSLAGYSLESQSRTQLSMPMPMLCGSVKIRIFQNM